MKLLQDRRLSPTSRYAVALAAPLLAFGIWQLLEGVLPNQAPLQLFTLAIVLAAVLGGFAAGMVATAVGALLAGWLIVSSGMTGTHSPAEEGARLAIFFANGIAVSGIAAAMRGALNRAERERSAARMSEQRLQKLADSMPQLVWSATPDGTIDYCNSRGAEYSGLVGSESGERLWKSCVHPDDLARTESAWSHSLKTKVPLSCEHRLQMADGTCRWHLSRAIPSLHAAGGVERWFGTSTDLHPQRLAQEAMRESEQRFRTMADGLPHIVWVHDSEGRQEFVNRTFSEFFGVSIDEIKSGRWQMLMHPDDADAYVLEFISCLRGRRPFHAETRVRRADGQWRWIESWGRPRWSASGEFLGFVGSSADITERKESEQDLEAARDAAVAANRAKDDFLATLSHELRTPLNPVLLVATAAAGDDSLPGQVRADFQMIADNVALEARLIDDLLDLNRVTHGKVPLERKALDVHATIRDAAATIGEDIDSKEIRTTFSLDANACTVSVDPVRIRQVLWNVLKNAVKFTPARGTLSITTENVGGGAIEIKIRDSGMGMTRNELARALDPFAQGEHAARKDGNTYGGLGLGLSISRTLIEQHGGEIQLDSPGRGKGTTVTIRLPLADCEPPEGSGARRTASGSPPGVMEEAVPGTRVLIVEDHASTRRTLAALLERRRFSVRTAASLAEARERVEADVFDILISDLGLPDGDGCLLMSELREKMSGIFGIAISGYGMETDLTRSRAAGFDAHLTKPVNIRAVERAISDRSVSARSQVDV